MNKLYYQGIDSCEARVLEIVNKDGKYHVKLDKNVFYPTHGGQPCDEGYINNIKVEDVYLDGDEIYHVLSESVEGLVKCVIDKELHNYYTAHHTGQHLLSAVFYNEFKANTVSFHLTKNGAYIDIDRNDLTKDDYKIVEKKVNDIILEDLEISYIFPTLEESKLLPLRKALSVEENIRIVKIGEYDYSACGGTHVVSTKHLRLCKILKWEKQRNFVRVEFAFADKALEDYYVKDEIVRQLNQTYSATVETLIDNINKSAEHTKTLEFELSNAKKELISYEANNYINNIHVAINKGKYMVNNEDKSVKDMQYLVNEIIKNENTVVCLVNNEKHLIIGKNKNFEFDVKDLFKELKELYDIKGGGSNFILQGGIKKEVNIEEVINKVKELINDRNK